MKPKNLIGASLLAVAILAMSLFTGCNTTKGLGKDVEKLGDKIQDKASR